MREKVLQYIESNWDACIKENKENDKTLIGLPYPYTVPAVGHFDELYYWDTYFTNIGLLLCKREALAKSNVDNMLYMVERYGFMPNGNRSWYLDRSQPPFLSEMVRDIYRHYGDPAWLVGAYHALTKEYAFWTGRRGSKNGLSHYGEGCGKVAMEHAGTLESRIGFLPELPRESLARHALSTFESGWDVTPRWGFEGHRFAAVDLNSLLYLMEVNMEFFAGELKNGEEADWHTRAAARREHMVRDLKTEDGLFLDCHLESGEKSKIFSAASIYPLFAGLADDGEAAALVKHLPRLETEYGILTCEKNEEEGRYQWNYPNGWPCLQYIAFAGLARYGYREEAKRIAKKYLSLVERNFAESGRIWEKYNVADGSIRVCDEYRMPAMMGWSAGVYLAADAFCRE